MSETQPEATLEPQQPSEAERIIEHKNRLVRRLRRMFADEPDMLAALNSQEDTSHRIPTFDSTESGGLDMTREWGNTLSRFGDGYILKIQPPSSGGLEQESIHAFAGPRPYFDVVMEKAGERAITYTFRKGSIVQSERILNRLESQLRLKKKVLESSD